MFEQLRIEIIRSVFLFFILMYIKYNLVELDSVIIVV